MIHVNKKRQLLIGKERILLRKNIKKIDGGQYGSG